VITQIYARWDRMFSSHGFQNVVRLAIAQPPLGCERGPLLSLLELCTPGAPGLHPALPLGSHLLSLEHVYRIVQMVHVP
jgi:hypothetical protein